jgi:hypothetical protein
MSKSGGKPCAGFGETARPFACSVLISVGCNSHRNQASADPENFTMRNAGGMNSLIQITLGNFVILLNAK